MSRNGFQIQNFHVENNKVVLNASAPTHNRNCLFFRDENDQIIGCRLLCECDVCLRALTCFCLDNHCHLVALGAGSCDILRSGANTCELRQRSISEMEEQLRAERENEKQHMRAMISTMAHALREEQQRHLRITTGGGLTRDKNGRLWTRAQLMAMCAEQQAEDTASRKTLDPATFQALKAAALK